MKKCWSCKQLKNEADFYMDRRSPDSLQKSCKICQSRRTAEYGKTHCGYFKKKSKERYQTIKLKDPNYNKKRYLFYREDFIKRRREYGTTVNGRIYALVGSARNRAKNKKIPFSISREWVMDKWTQQDGKCLMTGIKFSLERSKTHTRIYHPFAPSLDRIDCRKGYTMENTRLVIVAINLALNQFGEKVFRTVCEQYLRRTHDHILNP